MAQLSWGVNAGKSLIEAYSYSRERIVEGTRRGIEAIYEDNIARYDKGIEVIYQDMIAREIKGIEAMYHEIITG
jgi:hypothetical protein